MSTAGQSVGPSAAPASPSSRSSSPLQVVCTQEHLVNTTMLAVSAEEKEKGKVDGSDVM